MLTIDLMLLAEVSLDPLSGGAGWVGTGLLGSVLAWLLFVHLPAKDKLLKEYMEAKDKAVDNLLQSQWANLQRMEVGYRNDLKTVAEHCKQELESVTYQFNEELVAFRELVVVLRSFAEQQYKKRFFPDPQQEK